MKSLVGSFRWPAILAACSLATTVPAKGEWQAVEQVKTYAIAGQSGMELYQSIGERGPKVGVGRAIAFTDFKLTWTRKYEPRGDTCVLATARPKLIITYMLPKPAKTLPPSTQAKWDVFITGVRAHERIHGDYIKDLVKQIELVSVGLAVADDPNCKKIRKVLTSHLGELSRAHRQRSSDFDRAELSNGGNVHQLILQLVNGG